MDAAYSQAHAPQQLQADWQALVDHTREVRRAAAAAGPPVLGLPPSWARRSDGVEVAQARLQALWETGLDPAGVKLWRRKFLYFQGDGSQRPPYCGSFTLRRCAPHTLPAQKPGCLPTALPACQENAGRLQHGGV